MWDLCFVEYLTGELVIVGELRKPYIVHQIFSMNSAHMNKVEDVKIKL